MREKIRIRVRFARDEPESIPYCLNAISEGAWDAGDDFEPWPHSETAEAWVEVATAEAQALFEKAPLQGEVVDDDA